MEIDYEAAYRQDQIISISVDKEIRSAQRAAEALDTGKTKFSITGCLVGVVSPYTDNWRKTIGEHKIWGSADVTREGTQYTAVITIHEIDRYNFNRGQKDASSGSPDDDNGRFAEMGWGKDFTTRGTLVRRVKWCKGSVQDTTTITGGDRTTRGGRGRTGR